MALERPDLTGCLEIENCENLFFSDKTGLLVTDCTCDYNELGYGLEDGIELDDVTGAILSVFYPSLSTAFIFTFTIVNHVITACTLTDLNGTVTTVTSDLTTTEFPLNEFPINLEEYGITFPALTDGIVKWEYTISGTSDVDTPSEPFNYTTSGGILNTCSIECCIENKYLELDANCDCCADKKEAIKESEFWLAAAKYAINVGQDIKAQGFLDKAIDTCNYNCDC